ncbi:MAG: hypothetical protein J6Y85_02705 [Alphaproteobacteria bacterium]|nr:hypothetical protein [Alphaproteobacteria bacterium]
MTDFWANCTTYGGQIITANKYGADLGGLCNDPNDTNLTNNCNGKKFCLRANQKNSCWWSAFTWCEAIGGKLASFASVCPNTQMIASNTCPNVTGIGTSKRYWTSAGSGIDAAFDVNLSSGTIIPSGYNVRNYGANNLTSHYALCEEK